MSRYDGKFDWLDDAILPLMGGAVALLVLFGAAMLAGVVTSFYFDWPRKWEDSQSTQKIEDNKTINGSLKIELQQAAPAVSP